MSPPPATRDGGSTGTPTVSAAGLVSRCRDGEPEAWRELVTAYERLVYWVPRSYGLTPEDAADVTQTTFALLVRGLPSLRDDDALVAWLGTVARRQTWRVFERLKRDRDALAAPSTSEDDRDPGSQVADPVDALEEWTERAWLHQGLSMIDPACQELLRALYLDTGDPSYQAVASRLGKAVGTIGPARARCLQRLRAAMGER